MEANRVQWYRTPIDKATMKELTEKSDFKGFVQAGGFLLVFVGTGGLVLFLFRQQLWLPMIAACYLHSLFHSFVSMSAACHELSHGTVFKTKALNEFFYYLFCFLTWNNPVHFRASHGYHHQFTVHRGVDKEVIQSPVAAKLNAKNLLMWFTLDIQQLLRFIGRNLQHAAGNGDADYFFWDPLFPADDPRRRAMITWARIVVVGHVVLIVTFAVLELWVLIYIVSFGSFFATWLAKFCGALQHTGLRESVPDWRVTCHTVRFGPLLRFLYWNMNYHIEHHMFAAVPFYNLPKLHAVVRYDYPLPQRSFWSGMRTLWRIKRRQKDDPSYVFTPVFPEGATPVKWT